MDDRLVDSDGDDLSNYAEYRAGTNPSDASSRFMFESPLRDAAGRMVLRWQSTAGRLYKVQYSDDLVTWSELGSFYSNSGGVLSAIDATPSLTSRFYRLILQ